MQKIDYEEFRTKVESEKCDGKITKEKLLQFVSNYNKKQGIFRITYSADFQFIKINGFSTRVLFDVKKEGEEQALLLAMLYVFNNDPSFIEKIYFW